MSDTVRHINPFRETVQDYRKAGWFGTIPLPYKKKHPPPTGMIGKRAKHPTREQINDWVNDGKRHNIGNRLAGVTDDHEILGIDVDHYESGGKLKKGGDELAELETKLGPLPDAWIATSRVDGISGIRFFRVPRGLAFRGKANGQNSDIDIICKGNRFAVVWPSIHPSGEIYWWFPPGVQPTKDGRQAWDGTLPDARTLPLLPDKWIDYLSQNRMKSVDEEPIDIDSSVKQIDAWVDATFHGVYEPMCVAYQAKVAKQIKDIEDESTSHDKIVKAHWNLIKLAEEGHVGLDEALNTVGSFWANDVIERDKRDADETRGEVWRSYTNALRKIKAQVDEKVSKGAAPVLSRCDGPAGLCNTSKPGTASSDDDDPLSDIPRGVIKPLNEYDPHDDDNARHFCDIYSSLSMGPAVRYADGYGWIVWHRGKNGTQPRWELDTHGDQEMRRLWWFIRDRQKQYLDVLWGEVDRLTTAYLNPPAQGVAVSKAEVDRAKAKYSDWKKWSIRSGCNNGAEASIKAIRSRSDVKMDVNELDRNHLLIGVANGVLELNGEDVNLRSARYDDYITLNTGVPYEKPSQHAQNLWNEYLETFLPDKELRRCVQIILGHCIVGGNDEKVLIALKGDPNTGKSTMINAIEAAMGEYASTVDQSMLKAKGHFNESLAAALNNRFVVCSEFDAKDELSASTIKRVTGGTDKISVPIKHSMAMKEGVPQFVLIVATNGVLKISGSDKALKNRLITIPFNVVPREIEKTLGTVVKRTCRVAVLNWLVEGYKEYKRLGMLPTHQLIDEATEEFFSQLDDETSFFNEWLQRNDSFQYERNVEWSVTRAKMYQHYQSFCDYCGMAEHDRRRLSPHALTSRLRDLGLKGTGKGNERIGDVAARWWYGVKLIVPPEKRVFGQPTPINRGKQK